MPGTTSKFGYRYPLPAEAPDGPGGVFNLASDLDTLGPFKVDTGTGITQRWNGSAWVNWESDWITPGSNPATAGVTVSYSQCRYRYTNGKVQYRVVASVTAVGSGLVGFNLPSGITAVTSVPVDGPFVISHASNAYRFAPFYSSSTQIAAQYAGTGTPGPMTTHTNTAPWTVAVGDVYDFMVTIPV